MCNLKTIPLTSNTDKIEGLYLTFDYTNEIFVQDCMTNNLNINNPIKLDLDLEAVRAKIMLAYSQLFL
ncbi:hypothetical protein D3C72_2460620 [compost metagenome]